MGKRRGVQVLRDQWGVQYLQGRSGKWPFDPRNHDSFVAAVKAATEK